MIKRLFGKSADIATLPTGRLVTDVGVPADRAAGGVISDADLERIAARVAERLLNGPMADTVARVVADVSERLVREEIDRIRGAAGQGRQGEQGGQGRQSGGPAG